MEVIALVPFPFPQPGDSVLLRRDVQTGLLGPTVGAGSRALVTATSWGRVRLEVDGGLAGTVTVDVPARDCRVVESGTGADRFRSRTRLRRAVRIGALIALAVPIVQFIIAYWLAAGSFDGFLEYVPIAALESAGDFLVSVVNDPAKAVLLLGLGCLTWALAFGWPRKGKR